MVSIMGDWWPNQTLFFGKCANTIINTTCVGLFILGEFKSKKNLEEKKLPIFYSLDKGENKVDVGYID